MHNHDDNHEIKNDIHMKSVMVNYNEIKIIITISIIMIKVTITKNIKIFTSCNYLNIAPS